MKMTIVVPCYNEAENIPLILNRFSETIGDRNIHVIVINNGSTDNTPEILPELISKYDFAETILVPVNKGYGFGIVQGLRVATGDYIGWTHADMQTDPKDIANAYDLITKCKYKNVFIKGKRYGRPLFDTFFTNGMSLFESILFHKVLYDVNAQPNIFPRGALKLLKKPPMDFSLDLYIYYILKKYNVRMIRFPVLFGERIYGSSKWNTDGIKSKIKFIKRTVSYSFELKRKIG